MLVHPLLPGCFPYCFRCCKVRRTPDVVKQDSEAVVKNFGHPGPKSSPKVDQHCHL